MKAQVRGLSADELACRPGSVLARLTTLAMGDHPSRTAVADGLVRSTRELGRAALQPLRSGTALAQTSVRRRGRRTRVLLVLLRVGFTEPSRSPGTLVVSYT